MSETNAATLRKRWKPGVCRLPEFQNKLYPFHDPSVANASFLWHERANTMFGTGLSTHSLMTFFYWAFAGDRDGRERTRLWENRLIAARCFRDLVRFFLHGFQNSVYFWVPWNGQWRKCNLHRGVLDLTVLPPHQVPEAWHALEQRWEMRRLNPGNGIDWLVGSPTFSNVSDLLVGAFSVSKVERHPEVFQMMTSVMAQFRNLMEYLLPDVASRNPATLPHQPHHHIDKGMIQMWVSKLWRRAHSNPCQLCCEAWTCVGYQHYALGCTRIDWLAGLLM